MCVYIAIVLRIMCLQLYCILALVCMCVYIAIVLRISTCKLAPSTLNTKSLPDEWRICPRTDWRNIPQTFQLHLKIIPGLKRAACHVEGQLGYFFAESLEECLQHQYPAHTGEMGYLELHVSSPIYERYIFRYSGNKTCFPMGQIDTLSIVTFWTVQVFITVNCSVL